MRTIMVDAGQIVAEALSDELCELNLVRNRVIDLESTSISYQSELQDRIIRIEYILTRLYNNIANNIFYDKQVSSFEDLVKKSYENNKNL